MRIDILSIVPSLLESPFQHSIMMRAQKKGLLDIKVHDLRPYGSGKHKQIDDYQYGGGAGLVMMIEPIFNAIQDLKKQRDYDEVIYMSPDGDVFNQAEANKLSLSKNLIILCGHYKGIDDRLREHVITREISIGEYVLSGGELAAAVIVDAIGRLIPGVLNDGTSALTDSFQDNMIAPPVYSRPSVFNDWKVPDILLSGNDKAIEEWRQSQSEIRTQKRNLFNREK